MISAILFDKDGTLFDFQLSWSAWAKAFLRDVADGNDLRAAHLGNLLGFDWQAARFREDSCVIAGTDDDIISILIPEMPGVSRDEIKLRIGLAAAEAPMSEVVPLAPFLDGLKARGLRVGVATNDTESTARAHLEAVKVLDRFDFVTGADSGHGAKPGPGMCLAFAAAFEVPPGEVLMVGDSLHDLHAGRAAGMRTLAVLTGVAGADALSPNADFVLPSIAALPDLLGPDNRLKPTGHLS
ncbi:HAD family hydrolase [Nioella aestuarii]|uniref:HAD family hydrolase n=1 Tax=Nioella aestuarii TaxID=1662864 RepID=UPI003D7F9BAB